MVYMLFLKTLKILCSQTECAYAWSKQNNGWQVLITSTITSLPAGAVGLWSCGGIVIMV